MIFDWLLNRKKITKNKPISKSTNIPKSNSITFSVDEWKRCSIDISMFNPHEEISVEFGKMIHALNVGLYEDEILNCFTKLSKDYPFLVNNIQTTLKSWAITITNSHNEHYILENKPIPYIKPSSVFHKYNKN